MSTEVTGVVIKVLGRGLLHNVDPFVIARFEHDVDGETKESQILVRTSDDLRGVHFTASGVWVTLPEYKGISMQSFHAREFTIQPDPDLNNGPRR